MSEIENLKVNLSQVKESIEDIHLTLKMADGAKGSQKTDYKAISENIENIWKNIDDIKASFERQIKESTMKLTDMINDKNRSLTRDFESLKSKLENIKDKVKEDS
jgi:chromosome segregation ATPase